MKARRHRVRALMGACLAAHSLQAFAAPDEAARGAASYRRHCVQCHGERADGRGPLAQKFVPPPSDLAASTRSDEYKAQIITLGGRNMGRSEVMPEWGLELSGQEILALVEYLREVADSRAHAKSAKARQP